MKLFNLFILIGLFVLAGCSESHPDIAEDRKELNNLLESVRKMEEKAITDADYQEVLAGYITLQEKGEAYNLKLTERGLESRISHSLAKEVKEKIDEYSKMTIEERIVEEQITYTRCKICGDQFTGRGYEEVEDGVWRPGKDPYQYEICSTICGAEQTKKIHESMDKLRGYQQNSNTQNANTCTLCKGTGIEKNTSSLTDEYGRTCPMCDGKGYMSY